VKFINEKITSLDECLNANFNYESMRSRLASHSRKKSSKNCPGSKDLVPIVFGKLIPGTKKKKNSKTRNKAKKAGYTDQIVKNNKQSRKTKTIKILLDSGASASIPLLVLWTYRSHTTLINIKYLKLRFN